MKTGRVVRLFVGRQPRAPDGLSDCCRTGVHNNRLQLTKPNRGARPGAAIDRLRS